MPHSVSINSAGDIFVDGKVITPGEITKDAPTVVADVEKFITAARNKSNWNWKSAEKVVIYVATFVSTTNVFGTVSVPTNLREAIVGGATIILAALHISTPA